MVSCHWFPSVLLTAVLLLVAAVYAQLLSYEFLPFWDDSINIHRNPLYFPLSWKSLLLFWTRPYEQLYIPVTYSVWAALVALSRVMAGTGVSFGTINPMLFHGANILVHLLATGIVFLILRRLLDAQFSDFRIAPSRHRILSAAAMGSLTFALHPLQVEPVAWVSGLRDLLGGAFSLAAIALFLAWLDDRPTRIGRWIRYAGASTMLLLALGSKPSSVVTPALALLCGGWILHSRHRSRKPLLWLLPWFALALVDVVFTSQSQTTAELARTLVPFWVRPLVAADALSFYLWKLLWPFDPWGLCADYGRSPNSLYDQGTLFWSWLIPSALTLALFFFQKTRPYWIPCLLFVIGVLPTLGLIPFSFQIVSTVSDRYVYLAMLGPAVASGLVICRSSPRIAFAFSIILIPVWTIATLSQLPKWGNGDLFFRATLEQNPTSGKSRHNYACCLELQGKLPEALVEFQEAIRLRPSDAETYHDMALTLMKLGRHQEAFQGFRRSMQLSATSRAARNLASIHLMYGEPVLAEKLYRFAMRIDPGDLQNQRALAWLLATHPNVAARNGREAVALSEQIVAATNAQVPLFLVTLSAARAEIGDFEGATAAGMQAVSAFQRSGDSNMAKGVESNLLPALHARTPIRDNPSLPQ